MSVAHDSQAPPSCGPGVDLGRSVGRLEQRWGRGDAAARVTGAESAGMFFYSVATVTCLLAV